MYIEKIEKKFQNPRSFSGGIVYKRWEKSKAKPSEQVRTKEKKFNQTEGATPGRRRRIVLHFFALCAKVIAWKREM